jgi:hypothetical protein
VDAGGYQEIEVKRRALVMKGVVGRSEGKLEDVSHPEKPAHTKEGKDKKDDNMAKRSLHVPECLLYPDYHTLAVLVKEKDFLGNPLH